MDFWPEFLANSWGKEFVAGGFGGVAGIVSGYPLDTVRILQQQSGGGSRSAFSIFKNVVAKDGANALYRGMGAPLASVTIQVLVCVCVCILAFFLYIYCMILYVYKTFDGDSPL